MDSFISDRRSKMMEFSTLTTDVLIIGSGGASLRAAIKAKRHGTSVIVVTNGKLGK